MYYSVMNDFTVYLKFSGSWVEVPASNVTYTRNAFSPQLVTVEIPAPYCTTYRDATDIKLGDFCQVIIDNVTHERESSTFSGSFFKDKTRTQYFAGDYLNDTKASVQWVINRFASAIGDCTITGTIEDREIMQPTVGAGTVFEIMNNIATNIIFTPLFHYTTTSGDVFQFGTFKNTTPLFIPGYSFSKSEIPYENEIMTQTARTKESKTVVLAEKKPTTVGETEDPTMYQVHSQEPDTGTVAWQEPFTSTTSASYPSTGNTFAKWMQGCPIYIGDQDMYFTNSTLSSVNWTFKYDGSYIDDYIYTRAHYWWETPEGEAQQSWTDYNRTYLQTKINKVCSVTITMQRGILHKGRILFLPVDYRGSVHLTTDKATIMTSAPDFRTTWYGRIGKGEYHMDYSQYYTDVVKEIEIHDRYTQTAESPLVSGGKGRNKKDHYRINEDTGDRWNEEYIDDENEDDDYAEAVRQCDYVSCDDKQFNFEKLAKTMGIELEVKLNQEHKEYWRTRGAIDLTESPSNFAGIFSTKHICYVWIITSISVGSTTASTYIQTGYHIIKGYSQSGEWHGTESQDAMHETTPYELNVPSNIKSIWQDGIDDIITKVSTKVAPGIYRARSTGDYYIPNDISIDNYKYCFATFGTYTLRLAQYLIDGVSPITYYKNLTVVTTEHKQESGETTYTYEYTPYSYIDANGMQFNSSYDAKATYGTGNLDYPLRFCHYYQQNARVAVEGNVWKDMGCQTSYGKEECKWDHINEPDPGTFSYDSLSLTNSTYYNAIQAIGMYGSMVMDISSNTSSTSLSTAQKTYPVKVVGRSATNQYKEVKIGTEKTKLLSISSDAWSTAIDLEFAQKALSFSLYNSGYCTYNVEVALDTIDSFDDIFKPKEFNGVLKDTSIDFSTRIINYTFCKDE